MEKGLVSSENLNFFASFFFKFKFSFFKLIISSYNFNLQLLLSSNEECVIFSKALTLSSNHIYSYNAPYIMTFILKRLSLSQNELIKIRKEKDKKKANKIAAKAKKNLRIKLYLFFIIGMLLILFCWYYLAAFGAVYPNTQVYLIKDTLISFAISMCYPFVYNLIPGLFRFPALKAEKKDKKSLYEFSQILSKL